MMSDGRIQEDDEDESKLRRWRGEMEKKTARITT